MTAPRFTVAARGPAGEALVLVVDGDTAYVTDPAASEIHAIDLATGAVEAFATLPEIPDELTGVNG